MPDAVRVCTETDLDLAGNDALEWLVLTDDRILTLTQVSKRETAVVLTDLRFDELKGARGDSRVGSGMIEVEVAEGQFREVLRYSNEHAGKFGRLARKLHQRLAQQRPLVITSEDVWDVRRCVKCTRPVLQSSGAIIRGADGRTYRVCPRCVSKGQVVLRLLALMKPYWPFALLAVSLLGATIALDLVPPRLTKVLIDTVFSGLAPSPWFAFLSETTGAAEPIQMLVLLVILLAVVQLSKVLITVLNGALATHIGTRITFDIRLRLFRRLQEQSVAYYDQQSVGILITRIAQDTEELHGFISHITSGFLVQIVLLVAVGITLFTMNATLALYTLLPAPLVIATTFAYWRFVIPRYYHFADQRGRLSSVLYATLSGVRVVKAFGQEWREIGRFTGAAER
ncbi:MAG TPA: ABC transporter transmembrane domain-containing protein, partial [Chloroflexota bacterium]|nr:ABC transporter transmembrane domain-containing protein [Chloroflexota bacterium]